ncbi:hypothetical protein CHLNCDRAFT_56835 [Chlorella variabilis]|uniref:VTT domain-containing protein n=1 Tax=Chlorella variabilis TaxID=554065 RepID=E1Z6S4_CHLVA|nr:hypothetical protein CHLNCDRAFT_56835 [Chlorella variabilis]EFN58700.1 hypothetical protein CHLNCDRAFT_56835 [Chlorella variabilis]|eukprot:XP_005850802.1 hypothetical protein CHLNCDRAFT_56835 [Chlorella variabilis]
MASLAGSRAFHHALVSPGSAGRLTRAQWRAVCAPRNNCRSPTAQRESLAASSATGVDPQPAGEELIDEASTSGHSHWRSGATAAAALAAAAVLLPAGAAHASGLASEAAAPGLLEFVINSIEALGPWGPAAFVALVALAESIPLLPTQPFSLASGLLFGAQKGALCMLSGTTLAALLAFSIARGIGRPLAERIISHELSGSELSGAESDGGEAGPPLTPVQRKLAEVQAVIERGSFWQQAGAVLLLRMTPVVPFSASNYVLGLSPLPLAPYLAGSVVGMAFWAVFYASLGGASRSMLLRGVDPDVLLADLLDKAGAYTRELAVGGALLGTAALVYLGAGVVRQQLAGADGPDNGAGPGSQLGVGGPAGKELGSEIGGELSRGAAVGKELVSKGLKEWLGPSGGKDLAESRVKE